MRSAFVLALFALGCTGGGELPEAQRPQRKAPNSSARPAPSFFESVRFTSVPAGTFGPYVAITPTGGVALWAQTAEKGRAWLGVTFDERGQHRGGPQRLAVAPDEVGLAVVEPAAAGFTLLWTRNDTAGTMLESLELDARGKPRGAPIPLAAIKGEVVWIDHVATPRGSLAFWGVKGPGGADLFAALVGGERVEPKPFARGVSAWQAAAFGSGAAVGLVRDKGQVEVQTLDDHGAPAERVEVSASASAAADLDMVSSERGLLLAWSDHGSAESRVMLARLDGSRNLTLPPTPLAGVLGDQVLVRLVPPESGRGSAYLAWENLLERPAAGRAIVLAPVAADGSLGTARTILDHAASDGSLPELAATADGLAALTLARACRKGEDCAKAPLLPTFVELDGALEVKASEPLGISALRGEVPDLAWGLSCATKPCLVMAAQALSPTPIWAVRATPRATSFVPAARRAERSGPPRVASLEVLAKTEPLADLALGRLGSTSLAAWVTYFDPTAPWEKLTKPAADGRLDPPRALLQVRAGSLPPETISIRARSLGGVALGPSASGSAEALLAWTAMDFKLPQVFVTVVDDKAKKLRQRMLTRAPGEKSDVAVTGVGDGWLVAWIDERSGDPELYAARVNRLLQNAGPEKRITSAAGGAAEVALLPRGQDALVAWSDARDKEHPGVGDIYVALLKGADASLLGAEQVVAKTPRHSRSPALSALGKGALLAWIEESVSASGEPGDAEARVVELGADGRPVGSSVGVSASAGPPGAVAVDCEDERCRVLLLVQRERGPELWVADWSAGKLGAPRRLLGLTSGVPLTIPPAVLGPEVLLADRAGNQGRARRLLVDWK